MMADADLLQNPARPTHPGVVSSPVELTVNLDESDDRVFKVRGDLSVPEADGTALLLLLHGGVYSRAYWDCTYRPEIYSFVRWATRAGYATLALDRIGAGRSDRPPADDVTFPANAYVVHQVITQLRTRWARIVLVEHSMGAHTSILESATYADADGVVLTGIAHGQNHDHALAARDNLHPARDDALFAGSGVPDGYITTVPGSRRGDFYSGEWVEQPVLDYDEANKSTATTGEMTTIAAVIDPATSRGINLPTLMVLGELDEFWEGAPFTTAGVVDHERDCFSAAAELAVTVVPSAGHSPCLHVTAPVHHAAIIEWLNATLDKTAR
jgi:pimeloyl-ACP methyl ester carboxylesterase